jgi:cysteinyl-tRNA synthetase
VLSLFDTRLGEVTEIRPGRGGLVRMLTCGPGAGRHGEIGDLRAVLLADLIRRNGERQGLSVIVCQPVSDIGQIAEDAALDLGAEDAFRTDCAALNIAPPDYAPRTSESVGQVVELIAKLIDAGHAYLAESGDVYFDAASFPDGAASSPHDKADAAVSGSDADDRHSPADWPLWFAASAGDDLTLDAPWGAGLPTSDAACSALSLECLGSVVDVHVSDAGMRLDQYDKVRAESDSVAGHEVVKHWARCGPVLFDAATVRLADLAERGVDPLAVRLAFLDHPYREPMTLTWQALTAADTALRSWRALVAGWATEPSKPMCADYSARIWGALDDDLDTPAALRAIRELIADREIPAGSRFETFAAADRVFGLELASLVGQPRSQ